MSKPHPFSIRLFLPDGSPEGLRILTKSNWTGCGVVCPRALFPEAKVREEFGRPGIYILAGPAEEGELPTIYVGQGDAVRPRLEAHNAQKDFWTQVVFFTASDNSLNAAHTRYLEARLIGLAREAKRAVLDNGVVPSGPSLSEADAADAEGFLADMLSVLPLVGINAFEKPKRPGRQRQTLHVESKGVRASGSEVSEGFIVYEGSEAVVDEVPSIHAYLSQMRRDLQEQQVLLRRDGHFVFVQDYTFASPSTAAGVVLGRSANGRIEWTTSDGRSLKALQEASA